MSNELIETGRKPEVCQLVWEVQLVKVQQQAICSAGTENSFIEQFCSSVILTLLAIRCIYMVSLLLHAKAASVCSPSELEKGACWAACTEGSLSEFFITRKSSGRTRICGTGPAARSLVAEVPQLLTPGLAE